MLVDIAVGRGMGRKVIYWLFVFFVSGGGLQASVSAIEKGDREILEPFFKYLLTQDTLGYVLLGEKPVAFLGYTPKLSWKSPFRSLLQCRSYFNPTHQMIKRGWETWPKYSPALSDQFLIIEEPSLYSSLSKWVFVIHRDLFCEVVNENLFEFERVLGKKVTGEKLFEQVKRERVFFGLLKHNEMLLGILLGFGKNNSRLYAQEKMKGLVFFPEEVDRIPQVELPVFRARLRDQETMKLRERYLKCRTKIKEVFLDQNLLDQTFKILCPIIPSCEESL